MTEPLKPMTVAECERWRSILMPNECAAVDRLLADHAKMRNALRITFIVFAGEYAEVYDPPHVGLNDAFCKAYNLTEADCIAWNIFDGEST